MKAKKNVRRHGRYGEKTVLRRVPISVIPLLDCLLDKMKRLAQNDPKKTIAELGAAALRKAAEEEEKDAAEERRAERLSDEFKYEVF